MNEDKKPNAWDLRYAVPEYVYGTEPNGFLAEVLDRVPKGPVLSLGEGGVRSFKFSVSNPGDGATIERADDGGSIRPRCCTATRPCCRDGSIEGGL
jgi:hypothetical protein